MLQHQAQHHQHLAATNLVAETHQRRVLELQGELSALEERYTPIQYISYEILKSQLCGDFI